ncbi:MAG: PfkB family carbohydrate kinase [Dermatophilaceae bacterium]
MGTQPLTRPRVLCVGMLTLDVVHELARMPGPNEKVPELSQTLAFGGPAANAAATAAALGAQVDLVAGFGRSPFTALVSGQLAAAGVTWHDPASEVLARSPLSSILLTRGTGHRAVVGGAAPALPDGAAMPAGLLESADVVLLDGHAMTLATVAAERAGEAGIPVLLDAGSYKPGTEALLLHVDLTVLSADFTPPGGLDPLVWVREQGCPRVAQSCGGGPLLLCDEAATRIAVPQVDVRDTLGAGDVLHGAAAYALACTGLDDVPDVLRFASAVASLSCRYAGALGWAGDPAARELARRLCADHARGA